MSTRPEGRSFGRWVILPLLCLTSSVFGFDTNELAAQQDVRPIARTRLEPGPSVTVGQPLIVVIEVLVPSFFSGAPNYPDVELRDALVLFVFRGTNFTERIDGVTWAGQRREYHVYPQRPGPFEIPEIPVGVRYRPPGGRSGEIAADTASPPAVQFEATLPPEAEGLDYFISALNVELEEAFEGRPDSLLVGETLTRTLTATVRGALSMVIPPLSVPTIAGVASYPAPAEVEDIEGFGEEAMVGRRVESVAYVPQAQGDYSLPGVALQWWDVNAGQLRTATVPSVELHVLPNSALVMEIPLPEDSTVAEAMTDQPGSSSLGSLARWWGGLLAGVILVVTIAVRLFRRYRPRLASAWEAAQRRQAESEAAYFRRFRDAAGSNDPRATANALVAWLDRRTPETQPATMATFAAEAGDDDLNRAVAELGLLLYGEGGETAVVHWNGADLARAVARARRRPRRPRMTHQRAPLQTLNPN